jgi:hypothetical protein
MTPTIRKENGTSVVPSSVVTPFPVTPATS